MMKRLGFIQMFLHINCFMASSVCYFLSSKENPIKFDQWTRHSQVTSGITEQSYMRNLSKPTRKCVKEVFCKICFKDLKYLWEHYKSSLPLKGTPSQCPFISSLERKQGEGKGYHQPRKWLPMLWLLHKKSLSLPPDGVNWRIQCVTFWPRTCSHWIESMIQDSNIYFIPLSHAMSLPPEKQ